MGLDPTSGQVGLGGSKLHHEVLVAQNGDGLFEHGQVIWGEQDGRGLPVHGDGNPFVVLADSADDVGQVRLGVGQ